MHAVRSARPKLSLAVPTTVVAAVSKPVVPKLIVPATTSVHRPCSSTTAAPSPLTPTTRNTALNARLSGLSSSSLQVPSAVLGAKSSKKACVSKNVRFAETENVTLVSPCPREYYGEYASLSREERRWSRSQ